MRIVVFGVEPDEPPAIERWSAAHPGVELHATTDGLDATTAALAKGANAISVLTTGEITDPSVYTALNRFGIRVIALRSAGADCLDLEACRRLGIAVTNVPDYSPPAIAELTLHKVLTLNRRQIVAANRVAAHDYRWDGLMGRELRTQTVGVVGAGRIGSTVARYCAALGARVLAYDIAPRRELEDVLTYVGSLPELLEASDIVTLHVPLDASTRGMIDVAAFDRMRDGALFINCARGGVVDEDALVAALDSGRLRGAALDTMQGEAPVFNHGPTDAVRGTLFDRLHGRDNVLLTPHIAFYTETAVANMVLYALDNAYALLTGTARPEARPVTRVV